MDNMTEYKKLHKRAERQLKSGQREDMIDNRFNVDFKSKKSAIPQFKKYYKDKIRNKDQDIIFNLCLDLLTLIEDDKSVIQLEGTYIKTSTGIIKENPARKALKEDIKQFISTLESLNNSLLEEEDEDLDSWLNE